MDDADRLVGHEIESDSGGPSFTLGGAQFCGRCGGRHTRRQQCPADVPPAVEARPMAPAWIDRPVTAPSYMVAAMPAAGGVQHAAVQWISAIFCSIVLIVCLSVAGVYIDHTTHADIDLATQVAGALIAIAIGIAAGALPLYFTARAFSGVAYALLALTLVTGGLIMVTAAPVIRQMNTPAIAEYQGFQSLLTFGIISLLCGLGLTAVCVRWSLFRESRERLKRWARGCAVAYGIFLLLSSALFALLMLIALGEAAGDDDITVAEIAIVFGSLLVVTAAPGAILVQHGFGAMMDMKTRELRLPIALISALVFVAVVGVGQLVMRMETPIAAPMPVLHVLGAALPGLTYTALAARGSLLRGRAVRNVTWRQLSLAAAIALSVAVTISVYVEFLGWAIVVTALLVNAGAFEFATDGAHAWDIIFDYSYFMLSENEQLVANLIAAAVLAPLVEEFAKSLGVRFLMRPSTTRAQCFVLGAAAGAAFGFLEALMYGAGWITEDLSNWWEGMVIRAGSTSGHVLWTGITGVAWWYWMRGRHRISVMLFAFAIIGHGAWNGVFTIIDSRILFLEELSNRTIEIAAYIIVAVWSVAEITAIPIVARSLRDRPPPPVEATPLASMQAWLA